MDDTDAGPNSNHGLKIDQAKAWDTDTLATLGTLAMLGPSLCIFGFVLFDAALFPGITQFFQAVLFF